MPDAPTPVVILPRKPSELIRIGLEDLEKAEQSPNCVIEMGEWHTPDDAGKCCLCLAGSVMRARLGVTDDRWADAYSMGENEDQLVAINMLRIGSVGQAFKDLGLPPDEGRPLDRTITEYEDSPTEFKREMNALAADLAAAGY